MYRIVIVEDEECISEGIVNLIDWQGLDCIVSFSAANGFEALDFIENNEVDIIISDIKMPGMNGLELINKVSAVYPRIKSIVLTAYSSFDFAQKAFREGAVDFIIKNDFINELPKAISSAKKAIEKEFHEAKTEEEKEYLSYQELKKIKSYLFEVIALDKYDVDISDIEKYDLDSSKLCVCSFEISGCATNKANVDFIKKAEYFLSISVKRFDFYIIAVQENSFTVIFRSREKEDMPASDIRDICVKTSTMAREFLCISLLIGISPVKDRLDDLHLSYKFSQVALSRISDAEDGIVFYEEEIRNEKEEIKIGNYLENIIEALLQGKVSDSLRILYSIKDEAIISDLSIDRIKIFISEICFSVFNKLDFAESVLISNKENDIYQSIQQSKTIYSLFLICENVIIYAGEMISDRKSVKSYLVNVIDQYIKENYSNNISLENISRKLNISKSYLCRIYKIKTGSTLFEAINNYRIDQAKRLLKDPKYKIHEIGEIVGINDSSYFTNIFKKFVGCSPTEYRNS